MSGLRCSGRNSAPPTLSFEVAEFSPGLEGVVAAETAVSEVDGANGRLIYRGGGPIEDPGPPATDEETAPLPWPGELPSEKHTAPPGPAMGAPPTLYQQTAAGVSRND